MMLKKTVESVDCRSQTEEGVEHKESGKLGSIQRIEVIVKPRIVHSREVRTVVSKETS